MATLEELERRIQIQEDIRAIERLQGQLLGLSGHQGLTGLQQMFH